MRSFMRIALFALFVAACVLAAANSANGGKGGGGRGGGGGGGRGNGGGHGHSHGGGGHSHSNHSHGGATTHSHSHGGSQAHSHQTRKPKLADADHGHTLDRAPKHDHTVGDTTSGKHPWSMQRANEERKFNHRMDVADKLDRLSEKNGNEHLKDTAERMRDKAQAHYDKRMAKIDSKDPLDDVEEPEVPSPGDDVPPPGEVPPPPPTSPPVAETPTTPPTTPTNPPTDSPLAKKLTGRENAHYRQVRNEERKFDRRMDVVEQLRELGEQQNDPSLLAEADRLEQQALEHFEKRMSAIKSFRDRHGLQVEEPVAETLRSLTR